METLAGGGGGGGGGIESRSALGVGSVPELDVRTKVPCHDARLPGDVGDARVLRNVSDIADPRRASRRHGALSSVPRTGPTREWQSDTRTHARARARTHTHNTDADADALPHRHRCALACARKRQYHWVVQAIDRWLGGYANTEGVLKVCSILAFLAVLIVLPRPLRLILSARLLRSAPVLARAYLRH